MGELGYCMCCKKDGINNRCELHKGADGLGYCEDCLRSGMDRLGEKDVDVTPIKSYPVPQKTINRREEILDFIITTATSNWVEDFVNKYAEALKKNYSWIQILQNEPNDLVLLRLASELGYGKRKQVVLPTLSEAMAGGSGKTVKERKRKTVKA